MTIGVLLAFVAWVLAVEMKALLVGEAATRRDRSLIRGAVIGVPEVASVGRLLTMQLSSEEILVNLDVDLEDGLDDVQVEAVIDRIEEHVKQAVPAATRIFVELESQQ